MHEAPSIRIVNDLLNQAIAIKASDIHLESYQDFLHVRLRVDGILHTGPVVAREHMYQVINRIKVLAQLDISEKRMPQDGKFLQELPARSIDLRVSTFPTLYGEKVVIRILDQADTQLALEQLGMEKALISRLSTIMHKAQGFFVVTGPTGSGKTTTLYSLLSAVKSSETNITTLEDPIEYYVEGINQAQVQPAIGFTFARGIRSLLRQDPDIIMVGEMRDTETAQVAIQAALTGHMVLSTLHTSDAVSTVMRLLDMHIEPFLLNATLSGILAQRLARTLCDSCKEILPLNEHEQKYAEKYHLHITHTYRAAGCESCHGIGYKGRTGIFEFLDISHAMRNLITHDPLFSTLYDQAVTDGMKTLLQDAADKVMQGDISMQELIRILL